MRHECAEALGDIPGVEIEAEMAKYLDPKVDPVVRESCVVGIVPCFSFPQFPYIYISFWSIMTDIYHHISRLHWTWRTTTTARSSNMPMA